MIHDIKITPLKIISDDRGKVMHMLRKDSAIFDKFGEIYFSTIYHKSIKAWHLQKESTLNYVCITGKVKLVLFDNRDGSSSWPIIKRLAIATVIAAVVAAFYLPSL